MIFSNSKTWGMAPLKLILIHLTVIISLAIFIVIFAINYISNDREQTTLGQQKNHLTEMTFLLHRSIQPVLTEFQKGSLSRAPVLETIKQEVINLSDKNKNGAIHFFLFTYDGQIISAPYQPSWEGTNQFDIKDTHGSHFIQKAIETAKTYPEGNFITYTYALPNSDVPQDRIIFVLGIPELACVIGAGTLVEPTFNNADWFFIQLFLIAVGMVLVTVGPIYISIKSMAHHQKVLEQEIVERSKAQDALRQSARLANSLAHCASRLNSNLDLITVSESICEEAVRALDMAVATVHLFDANSKTFQLIASFGIPDPIKSQLKPIPEEAIKLDIYNSDGKKYFIYPDIIDTSMPYKDLCLMIGLKTLVSVRLSHETKLVGWLNVFSIDTLREFKNDELALLETLSDYMSISIYNARLFEQVITGRERMKAISIKLIEAQEHERRYLARELHDEIGQILTHIKINLDKTALCNEPPMTASLKQAQDLTLELIEKIRNLSLELRPTLLDDLGLLPAMISHFERYTIQTGIKVNFKYNNIERRFSADIESTIYRILQEALTNVARYANTNMVSVFVWANETGIGLQIVDEGVGFDVEQVSLSKKTGGLSGMKERAVLCGGELMIESTPGEGTTINLNIPLEDTYLERRKHDRNHHSGG